MSRRNSLIEMLFRILAASPTAAATDVTEIEQIPREYQRRGEDPHYGLCGHGVSTSTEAGRPNQSRE